MKLSKLIQACEKLSVTEWGAMRNFVQSPYHNKNKHVIALFKYLDNYYPLFKSDKIERKKVWQQLYGKIPFDYLKLRHISSLLLKVLEQFIAVHYYLNESKGALLNNLNFYRENGLEKHYRAIELETEKVKNKPVKAEADYYFNYELAKELELHTEKQGREFDAHLQATADTLDDFFILSKLKTMAAMYSFENVVQVKLAFKLNDEVLQHLEEHSSEEPLILLYYAAVLTLLEPEYAQHFETLKNGLKEDADKIPLDDLRDLDVLARNYCTKQLNTGKREYIAELFDLFKLSLDGGYLLNKQQQIEAMAYKNIVAVGLNLKEYDWIEAFIKTFSENLANEYRSDFYHYNLAKLFYERKDYSEVISLLSRVEYTDTFIALDARTLLLKTYFEISEYEALDALFDSFRQFIRRHKTLAYHAKNYRNLIKFTKHLTMLPPGNSNKRNKIKMQIKSEIDLTEKAWLLNKL